MNKKKLMILGIFLIVLLLGTLISLEKIDLSRLLGNVANVQAGSKDRIHFLNVGVGDCILIESVNSVTNEKEFALVDGGDIYVRNFLSGDDSYFKRVMGDSKLKYIIMTHNHEDHAEGIQYIAYNYSDANTKFFYAYNNSSTRIDWIKNILRIWQNNDNNFYDLTSTTGSTITPTKLTIGNFKIELLNTEKDAKAFQFGDSPAKHPTEDDNRSSIIELVTHIPSGTKTLLTGDMEYDDEYRFLCPTDSKLIVEKYGTYNDFLGECRKYRDENGNVKSGISYIGDIDILKLGHHGSFTSNTLEFVKAVNPENAIVTRDGKYIYNDSPYNSIDTLTWLVKNKNVYDTSFDFTGFDRVWAGDKEYFDREITQKRREAIVISYYSNTSGTKYSIGSSGYNIDTANLKSYFRLNNTSGAWENWSFADKYQNNKIITTWIYRPDDRLHFGMEKVNNVWYVLSDRQVIPPAGWHVFGNNAYYINASGMLQTSDFTVNDPVSKQQVTYKIANGGGESNTGYLTQCVGQCSGWIKDYDNKWFYINNSNGTVLKNWQVIDGKKYYFSPSWDTYNNGEMYTGWNVISVKQNNDYIANCYYFNEDGSLQTGSFTLNGTTYSADSEGRVTANSVKIGEYTYQCGVNVVKKHIKKPTASQYCKKNIEFTGEKQRIVDGEAIGFYWTDDSSIKTTQGTYTVYAVLDRARYGVGYVWDDNGTLSTANTSIQCKVGSSTKLKNGAAVNIAMKTLAGDTLNTLTPTGTHDTNITSIVKSLVPPESLAATSSGPPYEIVSTSDSSSPVYMWYDNGTIYYYSEDDIIYMNEDSSTLFQCLEALTSIDFSGFDTSKVTNMQSMFTMDYALTSLDLRSFNTKNVTNMSYMFSQMRNITSINVSSFDTSKVTDMRGMFGDCERLTSLDITNFNTSNVTTMTSMFTRNYSLTSLDLSSFDTSKVTNMNQMFEECSSLVTIYASTNFKLDNVSVPLDMGVDKSLIFRNCNKLVGGAGTVYSKNTAPANSTLGRVNTDYLVHDADTLILRVSPFGREYYKANDGDALVAYFFATAGYTHPILISTDPDAVAFRVGTRVFTYSSTYEYNNKTYYINSWEWGYEGNLANDGGVAKRLPGQHMSYDAAIEKLLELGYDVPTGGDGLAYAHIDVGTANPGYFTAKESDDPTLYKIRYDCGLGTGDAPDTQFVRTGDNFTIAITPNTCSKEGYSFNGWNLEQDGTGYAGWTPGGHWTWRYTNGQYGINNKELVLYASWKPIDSNTYTITYNCGSGTGTAPESQTVQNGINMVISGNDDACSKEGYVFTGWNTEEDGSGNPTWYPRWEGVWRYKNGQYGIENNELHLYAQYSPVGGDIYTITYDCGIGADGTPPITNKLKTGDKFIVSLTPKTCSKPGYVFDGWNTQAYGTGDPTWKAGGKWTWNYTNGYFGIENNSVTLYAQWKLREGSYLDSINKEIMSVGNNTIIALIEQNKKNLTASALNDNLDKSSGWSLYKKNGTLVNGSSSSLGANIYELLGEEDEEEDPILATGDYLEHDETSDKYTLIISGDIYADGYIDVKDLYQSFLLFKGREGNLSDEQYIAGDYDGSGKLDLVDLYKIYKKMKE